MRVYRDLLEYLSQRFSIHSIVAAIGISVSAIAAVLVPVVYLAVGSIRIDEALEIRADLSSSRAAKYIFGAGELWPYHHIRLKEILELSGSQKDMYRQTLLTSTHQVVVEDAVDILTPVMLREAPVVVNGKRVGTVRIETSLRPLLTELAGISIFGLLVGLFAYWGMTVFPLRALAVTVQKLEHEQNTLRVTKDKLSLAVESMSQGLALFDPAGRLLVANARLHRLIENNSTGLQPQFNLPELLEQLGLKFDRMNCQTWFRDLAGNDASKHQESTLPNGRSVVIRLKPAADVGLLITVEDVTRDRRAQAEIEFLAHNDTLTGLANRNRFQAELTLAMAQLPMGESLAVLCLDLDRFKNVNDTLGHGAGDTLLKLVAARIKENVRKSDVVARLGGDEFAIIQRNGDSAEDLNALAGRIVEVIRQPFDIDGTSVQVGTSIGIAIAPLNATAGDDLMKKADIALYKAKADGRNTYRFFETGMDEEMLRRLQAETDLKLAVAQQQFELHYQPLYDLTEDVIVGFEALIRWRHPERGMVPPSEFIPLAEETGLIKQIGSWVIQQACNDAARWPECISVSVNLSAVQFNNSTLFDDVQGALKASGLDAHRLELEITESIILQDTEAVLGVLQQLKALGCKVAMDDFGTGYSSLAYLQRFPFDKIKIDRAFITDLNHKDDSLAIVRAVTSLSRSLGMKTTGEGVETIDELRCLREEGCTQAQGYFISKPVPVEATAKLIDQHFGSAEAA